MQIASNPEALATLKNNTSIALKKLTSLYNIKELVYQLRSLKMDINSQKVFLIKCENIGWSIPYYVTHIMDHIQFRIAVHLWNLDSLQQINFYCSFASFYHKEAVEHVLELFFQQNFQRWILINYVSMVWFTRLDRQHKCQLHASYYPLKDELDQNALYHPVTLNTVSILWIFVNTMSIIFRTLPLYQTSTTYWTYKMQ